MRAGMVDDSADYIWSSYQCIGLGKTSSTITTHEEYIALGKTGELRRANYRASFDINISVDRQKDLMNSLNKGLIIDNDRFKDEMELNLKRRVRSERRGPKLNEFLH